MKNYNIQEEPKVNFCNGLLLESMHIFTVNYHVLGNPLLSNVQWSNCYPEKLCVLNCVFISSVNGGISSLGIKKVDMLNRSKNILYLSLNVDRRYCKIRKIIISPIFWRVCLLFQQCKLRGKNWREIQNIFVEFRKGIFLLNTHRKFVKDTQ